MKLIEEYLKRHDLNVPMIYRQNNLVLFTKQKNEFPYHIHNLHLHKQQGHPNVYRMTVSRPIHNGFKGDKFVERLSEDEIPWEDYEASVVGMANKKSLALSNPMDIGLAAWEMFIHVYDSILVSYANNDAFYSTIDPNLSAEKRYENYKTVYAHFDGIKQTDGFRRELEKWMSNYWIFPPTVEKKK